MRYVNGAPNQLGVALICCDMHLSFQLNTHSNLASNTSPFRRCSFRLVPFTLHRPAGTAAAAPGAPVHAAAPAPASTLVASDEMDEEDALLADALRMSVEAEQPVAAATPAPAPAAGASAPASAPAPAPHRDGDGGAPGGGSAAQ